MSTPAVSVREWTDVVRRARLGKTTKYIALMLATYADFRDGTRVRPGVLRLAWAAEVNRKTVDQALSRLLRVGLIEMSQRRSGQPGSHDEYRLVLGDNLMEEVEVPSPAQATAAVEGAHRHRRSTRPAGRTKPFVDPAGRDERGANMSPIEASSGSTVRPVSEPQEGVVRPVPRCSYDPPDGTYLIFEPTQEQVTTTTSQPTADLRTAVTVPGARDRHQDQISTSDPDPPPRPERCAHGLKARTRADGSSSCALCRKGAPPAAPKRRGNVVPFPRTA